MTQNLTAFWTHTKGSMRDLAPIVFVIGFFEFAVLQQVPDGLFGILVGVVLVEAARVGELRDSLERRHSEVVPALWAAPDMTAKLSTATTFDG